MKTSEPRINLLFRNMTTFFLYIIRKIAFEAAENLKIDVLYLKIGKVLVEFAWN